MVFGILGAIVAFIFVLLVISYATSTRKEMTVTAALGSATFLLIVSALFFVAGRNLFGLSFFLFAIYALSRYVKIKKMKSKPAEEEENSRSLESNVMSEEEALKILGLNPNPSRADVQAAFKREMKANHPDRVGDDDMAKKINRARDTLLG